MKKLKQLLIFAGMLLLFAGGLVGASGSLVDLTTLLQGSKLTSLISNNDRFAFVVIAGGLFLLLLSGVFPKGSSTSGNDLNT